jgi:hypothetical protein
VQGNGQTAPNRAGDAAVSTFIARKPTGPERRIAAHWFLSRYVHTEEAFLYSVRGGELEFLASAPEGRGRRDQYILVAAQSEQRDERVVDVTLRPCS